MTTYKIRIWLSNELIEFSQKWENDAYKAAKVAKTYLEEAFHAHSDSADVTYSTNGIPAPREDCTDFDGEEICSSDSKYWNSMFDWWRNYAKASCTDLNLARDTNLLITKNDHCTGGAGTGHWAYACVGISLLELDPDVYNKFGSNCEDFALDTIQEEVAHSLHWNNDNPDKDGDGKISHDYGTVKYDGSLKGHITPVGQVGKDGPFSGDGVDYNNCDEFADKSDTDWDGDNSADGWAHWYSDCSINWFTTTRSSLVAV